MKSKKVILFLMALGMILISACFASDLVSKTVQEKTGEITDKLSDEALEGLELTVESATGLSLEGLDLTQVAFGELNAEDIQATVNSAIGMDEEAIRAEFFLPEEAINITKLGDMVNFQVAQPMLEVVDFYQVELPKLGYQEREITTAITDITASIVYTGHESGKLLVVQMVALNDGLTNISIRLEAE